MSLFRGAPPVFVVLAAAVALLSLVPVAFIVQSLVQAGPARAKALIWRPRVGELLLNTGLLTVLSMAACAVLGTACAFLIERTTVPGARFWAPMLVTPLAVPAFVTSYGWVSVVPGIDGLFGATLIMTLAYFPLVLLPVAGALRGTDPAWEEQARSLGLGPVRTFRRVTLPQLRPALLGGSLLVGLHTLAEFGAFQNLGFSTFTTAIYEQYQSTFASTAGNMLAVVLVVCCLVLVAAEFGLGRGPVARTGSGSPRPHRRVSLGWWNIPAVSGLVAVVGAALGVPVSSVVHWLVLGGRAVWTSTLWDSAVSTVALAAGAALFTTALAFPAAYLAVRHRGRVSAVAERVSYVAGAVPSLVVGLALVTLTVHYVKPIYQTYVTLFIAYVVLLLPRALVSIRSGLTQSRVELEEASRALGKSRLVTLARITVPLASPGLAVAATLVFLAAATELTATLMLGPTGLRTLSTRFWSLSGSIDYVAAAPYAALLIVISLPVTFFLLQQSRRAAGR
ncbi:iron(III) transport system permease protein [Nakamurella sp. UYEF19]|uniref:ABC transporter permease n=1 Tax=Nakamurella sp. UYEF19 TaxID=1756392 RepID=UPI00339598B1